MKPKSNDKFFTGNPKLGQVIKIEKDYNDEVTITFLNAMKEEKILSFSKKIDYYVYYDVLEHDFVKSKIYNNTPDLFLMYILTKGIISNL